MSPITTTTTVTTSSQSAALRGLPRSLLKQMATVEDDLKLSILDWINRTQLVYLTAVDADQEGHTELAYLEYYRAASILHVILKRPEFKDLKTSHPEDYQKYTEIAPKVLASTNRAKQLGQLIESDHQSTSNPGRPKHIAGGISSRIKSLEAAGLAGAQSSSTHPSSTTIASHNKTETPSAPASPVVMISKRRQPSIPNTSLHNASSNVPSQPSLVSVALEAQSAIRSGSAPPELNLSSPSSASALRSDLGIGQPSNHPVRSDADNQSNSTLEHALLTLRSPSEFAQIFPQLETLSLDHSITSHNHFPDLPSVPKTLPASTLKELPPPPQPFYLSSPVNPTSELSPGELRNDTSLGAGLTIETSLTDHRLLSGAPPAYPDFQLHPQQSPIAKKPSHFLSRSHAIRSPHSGRPSSSPNRDDSPPSLPKKPPPQYSTPDDTSRSSLPPTLPTDTNSILPAVLIDYFRKSAAADMDTKVLFLDVRERDEFDSCRIKSTDVVCIEPLVLRKNGGAGVSSQDIEQSLVISPRREQALFERRHEFDYVIFYDKRSVTFPSQRSPQDLLYSNDPSDAPSKLLLILYLAIHQEEYVKPLKRPPLLLIGGIEGWTKVAGETGIIGKGPAPAATRQHRLGSTAAEFSSSMNGTLITLRQPINGDPAVLQNDPDSHDESAEIKKARRQVALFQQEPPTTNSNFIARSVADLTKPSGNPSSPSNPQSPAHSPTFYQPRPSIPHIYSSYPNGAASPITLPQQTLQRAKSSQVYDASGGPPPPTEPIVPSAYTSTHPIHSSSSLYPSHSHPLPPHYGAHQQLFPASRPIDTGYGTNYLPTAFRPSIQYPVLQSHSTPRPPQPPPPAVTPGGGNQYSNYYHRPSYAFGANSTSQSGLLQPTNPKETPPLTPYSPNRHGPSEIYFNPSFEDGQVGLTGLKNLGNTCYMNSTLQCISATIPLARFFKDGSYKRCINRVNPLGTQGQLAESVAELVRVLWGAQYTFVSPITFREAICKFAPQFRGSDQHDAQEFLGFLLDGLHEDLNLVISKPKPIEMTIERETELESLPNEIASKREWEIYKRRENSVIVELFQGQYRSRLQCLTCSTTSTTYNTFMYLSLPIPTKRGISKVSLTQCLDAFLKEEIMEKDDAWNCPKCKQRRKATKRLSIARLPPILLIHLKRFSFKGPFSDKLETFVQYPIYGLDLSSYIPTSTSLPTTTTTTTNTMNTTATIVVPSVVNQNQYINNFVYDLYAVCNHFGSLSSGHYTAFVRSQKDWYNIGDSRVSKTDEKSVKARSAYLLCFRRRD